MKKSKEQKLDELIRLTFESLESHLEYTHKGSKVERRFHKKCVKDYSVMIKLLSELL